MRNQYLGALVGTAGAFMISLGTAGMIKGNPDSWPIYIFLIAFGGIMIRVRFKEAGGA